MSEAILPSDIDEVIEQLGDVADGLAGRTMLLAGGLGFLGRYLTALVDELNRRRLSSPCTLIIVDNLITSGEAGLTFAEERHRRFLQQDICQGIEIDGRIDFVVHAAGVASPLYYRAYPLETLDVAIVGTRNLLRLAQDKGARFTFFSSSEIYGDPDPAHIPTRESYHGNVATQGRRACYDEGKRVGETLCYIFHSYHGVPTTVLRPFNVYGPGMQENDYRVLPNFASAVKGDRPLNVYGTGSQTRTFCYVSDALNGFIRAITAGVPGQTYNIGNPTPEISMKDLATRVGHLLGKPVKYEVVDYPHSYPGDEPNRRCPDITKAREQLGYHPRVDLDTGLARFLAWADVHYTGQEQDGFHRKDSPRED